MGTRADFYKQVGCDMHWLGSIAYDGYPDGLPDELLMADNEETYLKAVQSLLNDREDCTFIEDGWPWPWVNSETTDYAYIFKDNKVWGSCFGSVWFDARDKEIEDFDKLEGEKPIFPDMTDIQKVSYGKNSGLMIFSV